MITASEVAIVLRGWGEERRRVRVLARLNGIDFSAYCFVRDANEVGALVEIGDDPLNMASIDFRGFTFDFTDAPPDDDKLGVPGRIESGIVCVRRPELSIWFFLLRDE